jgi:DNA polymerase III alpha subunit
LTGLAAIPYKTAEELGYFKLDFLHVGVYDHFTSREEIQVLIKQEPDWTLLTIPSVVSKLFQISKHHALVSELKPRSVIELADCLALIRPQKRYLLKYYQEDREKTREFLYKKEPGADGYAFKKAHAIAYALVIVLELHLIKAGIL